MKRMVLWVCALAALLMTQSLLAADAASKPWQVYEQSVLKLPGLLRYYTFNASDGNGKFVVDHVAKGEASVYGTNTMTVMSNSPYGEARTKYVVDGTTPYDYPYWTTGRFAGQSALATGLAKQGVVRSQFYGTPSGDMTLIAWIRVHDNPGDHDGGSLLYCGSGWKQGFKIYWSRAPWAPQGSLGLEVGTKTSKETIKAKSFTPGVWHCIAFTWSKGHMALYVDGKLSEEKTIDQPQIIWPTKADHALLSMSYYDVNGLGLGRNSTRDGDCRTDFDELVILDNALPADQIASLYQQGKPGQSPSEQLADFQSITREKQLRDRIKLDIPKNTYGYFRQDQLFDASITVPPDSGLKGTYQAQFTITDLAGKTVLDQTLPLEVDIDHQASTHQPIQLQQCGLYWLNIKLTDEKHKLIKSQQYPFAITVKLPPMQDVPLSFPVCCHHMVQVPEHAVLGNKCDRIIRGWAWMQRKKDEMNFTFEDRSMERVEKLGMNMLFTIDLRPPAWVGYAKGSKNLPADMGALEHFLRVLVSRYKGRVAYWEIFNEPNSGHGLQGPNRAKDYVTYLKLAYRVIKEVDPQAKVIAFCGVHRFRWFTEVMDAKPGNSYDIVSLHNYGSVPIRLNRERRLIQNVRELLDKNGRSDVPIWNGECGFAQPARINGRPITDKQLIDRYASKIRESYGIPVAPGWMPVVNEHRSASWQAQSILLELALGTQKYFMLSGGSHYSPNYNTDDGTPSEKGIAKAMVSSMLLNMQHISRLQLASSDQEAGLIAYKDGSHRLAAFSVQPSALTLAVDHNGTYTGMDMLGNPLSWQARNGVLQIPITEAPVYINDVPKTICEKPIATIQLAGQQLSSDYKLSGKVHLANPWDKPITLTLKANLPNGTTIEIPQSVIVPAGKQMDMPFEMISRDLWRGWYDAELTASLDDQIVSRADAPFYSAGSVVRVPEATKPITVDADPHDWPKDAPKGMAYWERQVVRGKPIEGVPGDLQWRGRDDLSFNVKTCWQAGKGLYFLMYVTDDKLVPSPDQTRGYLYDGLELFVDTRPGTERPRAYSFGAQQMIIYPQFSETAGPCKVEYCGHQGNTVALTAQGRRTQNGYLIEGLIAPAKGYEDCFKPGSRLYLDFNVNDTDSLAPDQLRKSTMSLHSMHAKSATDSSQWGTYELTLPAK